MPANEMLYKKLVYFKSRILKITPYYDAMVLNEATKNRNNFTDAVHTNELMGDILLENLLNKSDNK